MRSHPFTTKPPLRGKVHSDRDLVLEGYFPLRNGASAFGRVLLNTGSLKATKYRVSESLYRE